MPELKVTQRPQQWIKIKNERDYVNLLYLDKYKPLSWYVQA